MNIYEFVGAVAVILSSFNLLPQVYKGFKTKSVNDISWIFVIIIIIATVLWFIYGMYRNDWAILMTNAIIFLLANVLLLQKIIYRKNNKI